jgi:D-mannonate dehydratase
MSISRRKLLQAFGTAALVSSPRPASAQTRQAFTRMPAEGKDTPKICLGFWATVDEPNMRRVKQIGVDYVLTGGPRIPWDEADVRARIDRFKAGGLTLSNMMISGFDDVIWGRPGADAQIANVIMSIRAAGKAGLPVIEYNFYANRLVRTPYIDYTEVFLDDGQVDMFGVMKELVRQKYPRAIYPEHPRAIDVDREAGTIRNQYPGGGGFAGEIYNVAYTRAMLQAALTQ